MVGLEQLIKANSNHVYSPFILMYSKQLWDIVSVEDKPIIEQAAKEGAL